MKKFLIIKPSGIGDIVHSLPVAITIKRILPQSEIHWLVFSKFSSILRNTDYIDKAIQWDRDGGIREYFRVLSLVRKERYDVSIDLQGLMRTALINSFSRAKSKLSVSLLREGSWLFERPVSKYDKNQHAVERNYEVVRALFKGKEIPSPIESLPWIKVTEEEKQKAEEILDEEEKVVVFNVSSRGEHKIWPAKNFAKLINLMYEEYGTIPVFLGTLEERLLVERVEIGLSCRSINLVGKTDLRVACGIIERSRMVVGNDSGLTHISAALNKPVLAIFGATNPVWFYPYNEKSKYIYKEYKCSPCGIKPRCKDYKCMLDISVEEVFEFVKSYFSVYLVD